MHSRRPLPALALVLPHPPLPTRASLSHLGALSPHTPRACTPSTPVFFPKQLVASPRTSTDSWNSSKGDDEVQWEWKTEQLSLLTRTLDALPGHLLTPFNGPVPPSNLLDKIAKSVSQAQGPLEWPHSVRATRAKLVEISRARGKENMTIDEQDEDGVSETPGRHAAIDKRPLYRQSSMDFLPSKDKGNGSLSRLSSRLQRTDRIIPTYHPYPRPTSRSPSPPARTPRSETRQQGYFPPAPVFASSVPQRTLRPRTSSNSLGSRVPPAPLRRSASTMSTHSNPMPGSTPSSTGVLPAPRPISVAMMRRSDSFSYAAPVGPPLKRAPSFGASSIASGVSAARADIAKEKQPQEPESDDEEKAREKKAKRPRTRSATTTAAGSPEKKRHEREKKKKTHAQKELGVSKPASSPKAKSSSRPKPTRGGSMFGAELPQPQAPSALPSDSPSVLPRRASASPPPVMSSGSPPKTLRRVKTTTFNLGPCAPARRISFGSLAPQPEEEQERESDKNESTLGSAFQMS